MYFYLGLNIIEVLFFCGVIILMDLSLQNKFSQYVKGVIFGLITILIMSGNSMLGDGRLFDFRHITMTMAGFIGGPVTAAIAALMSSIYRFTLGGNGMISGITDIIIFGCVGSGLGRLSKKRQDGKRYLFWYLSGLVMALLVLSILAFIPPGKSNSLEILKNVTGPYLIITPIAATLIFNFYYWAYEYFSKAAMLNTVLKFSPLNLMIFDKNGPILLSENLKKQFQLTQYWPKMVGQDNSNLSLVPHHQEIVSEDGRCFVVDCSRFFMPNGEPACVAIMSDITERKREQETIKRLKNRFAKAFDLGPNIMAIIRKSDYRYLDVNNRFLEARGFVRDEVIGKTPLDLGLAESELKKVIKILKTQGSVQNLETTLMGKNGNLVAVALSAQSIQIEDQECLLIALNDLTEIKQMQAEKVQHLRQKLKLEEELSSSNQLIADIITNMPDVFYVLDNDWRFTYVNKRAEEYWPKSREELIGEIFWEVLPEVRGTIVETNYRQVKEAGVPITFDFFSFFQKGAWFRVHTYPFQSGLAVYYTNISEKKLMREKLIASEKKLTAILESLTDCFFAVNENLEYTYVNSAAEIAFGKSRDELLGRKMTDVYKVNEIALQNFDKVMSEKRPIMFEVMSEALGNKWLEVSVCPAETGMTGYFRDITRRKLEEREFARLDRLNIVGQMAAAIGHEVRNPMTTVRGYLQLLGEKPEYESQKYIFDLMISELDRANYIISEFLSLARTKQTDLKYQNLNDILSYLYPLLEADSINQNKQIRYSLGQIPNLKLNKREIIQLVLNFARNGFEAMKEGGNLLIATYQDVNKVVLAIEDEGCGIPLEYIDKIGTPFFTTKENGTGLGLATSYKTAKAHSALIEINSSSKGTKFLISFPVLDDQQQTKNIV